MIICSFLLAKNLSIIYNKGMFKFLRMFCSILAALLTAGTIFVFVYLGWEWGFVFVGLILVLFFMTKMFKDLQQKQEAKNGLAQQSVVDETKEED